MESVWHLAFIAAFLFVSVITFAIDGGPDGEINKPAAVFASFVNAIIWGEAASFCSVHKMEYLWGVLLIGSIAGLFTCLLIYSWAEAHLFREKHEEEDEDL